MAEKEFKDVLIEVRKAYRLLYSYQKRVLDLVGFIGDKLSLTFEKGKVKFSGPRSKARLDDWAWDWLGMYYYKFSFGKVADEVKFSIILQSDTGFFESGLKTSDGNNRLKVEEFKEEKDSNTRLIFVCGKKTWGEELSAFLEENFNNGDIAKDGFCAKAYDLADFIDEESTIKKIEDFLEFAKSKCEGLSLNNIEQMNAK